jgi:hypothetical protein
MSVRYNQKRFGIKKCKSIIDADKAHDLLNILNRAIELDSCDASFGSCCSLTKINETINTL